MNTIPDMVKAIKQLQKEVAELNVRILLPSQPPLNIPDTPVTRRGRPRKAEDQGTEEV